MENTEAVELFLQNRAQAGDLLEIVGVAFGLLERLEAVAGLGLLGLRLLLGRFGRRLGLLLDRFRLSLGRRHLGFACELFGYRLCRLAHVDPRGALGALDAVDHRLGDEIAIKRDRPAGVVVARDRMGNLLGIAIGIDHGDDGDVELVGLGDRDRLLVGVDDEDDVGNPAHVLDAAQGAFQLVTLAREVEELLLGEAVGLAGEHLLEHPQPLDRVGDGLPIGERAAQPTVVDVILRRTLGRLRDGFGCLTLGADEQHPAALGNGLAHGHQRLMQHRHGLRQIDDVDVVAYAEDEGLHFGVPAVGLVAKMNARLQELAHVECR